GIRVKRASSDVSMPALFIAPTLSCAAMLLIAGVTTALANVDPRRLLAPYMSGSISVTALSVLIFAWVRTAQLARTRRDHPIQIVLSELRARAVLLLLPAIIFPLFLSSYAAAKTSIPFLVGYTWDPFWAAADRLLFR